MSVPFCLSRRARLCAAVSLLSATLAYAQAPIAVDVPAAALEKSLNTLARQAGVQILFASDIAAGKTAPALKGNFTPREALDKLLQGNHLRVQTEDGKTFTVIKDNSGAQPKVLRTMKIQAAALNDTTEGSGSYTAGVIGVGGRMGESLREVPRSVSVITRQQLDDQRTISLYDAINQLPGVTTTFSSGNAPDASFYSRGHALTTITADGMRISTPSLDDSRGGGSNSGMAKYDNVQLLRGPDSLFSGNSEPSGSINMVRKRPTDEFQLKTALSTGSWDNRAAEIDISSPLFVDDRADHKVRGRAVLARNTSDHFYGSEDNRKSTIYGIIDAQLWEGGVLAVGASLDTQHGAPDQPPGLPRYATGEQLDISRSTGYPDWVKRSYDTDNLFVTLDHRFNDQWTLKTGVSKTRYRNGHNIMAVYDGMVDPQTLIGDGAIYTTRADWSAEVKTANINLIGDLDLWNRHQQFALGADYSDATQYSLINYHDDPLPVPNWSNFDPGSFTYPLTMAPGWDNDSRQKQKGIYAYGNFQIVGPWKLVLGGRYASFDSWTSGYNAIPAADGSCADWATTCGPVKTGITAKSAGDDGIFTPYYGVTVDISANWTAYLTHAEGYEDQSNYFTPAHSSLDPTESKSWELGLKGEHFDGRLNSNITLYDTRRDNYRVEVSSDDTFNQPGRQCCFSDDGKFLSQGIEIDISGALTADWQLNAGYTYDDNKTEYGDDDGARYASYVPKHTLRLWSSYDLHRVLAGLRVGGGVQAQSSSFQNGTVNLWNPTGGLDHKGAFDGDEVEYKFTAPGYALWNAFAEYRFTDHWTAALNINNLFDRNYLQVVGTTSGDNYYGTPRNAMLTLRGEF